MGTRVTTARLNSVTHASPGAESTSDLAELDRAKVPALVRATAEWGWRLLVIAAAVWAVMEVFSRFEEVLVPVALAILVSAMLVPFVDLMNRHRTPRSLAVVIAIIGSLAVVAGVMTFVVREFVRGLPALTAAITETVDQVRNWLVDGPLRLDEDQVRNFGSDVINMLQNNQERLTSGALATATTATEILTGALLTLFLVIFFLYGGGQIWEFVTRVIPRGTRPRVHAAGIAGFGTLIGYVRATVVVAFVDALGIGVGLAILQVPLALPLGSLVFLGAFVPIVGALATGTLAVLVALVTKGWIAAVIALAIVVGVMQLESHVLQPFLLGRTVRLHPVAVVLAIAGGIVAGGIVGGLLAVPLIAFANTAVRYLHTHDPTVHEDAPAADAPLHHAESDSPTWDRLQPERIVEDLPAGESPPGESPPGESPPDEPPQREEDSP